MRKRKNQHAIDVAEVACRHVDDMERVGKTFEGVALKVAVDAYRAVEAKRRTRDTQPAPPPDPDQLEIPGTDA